MSNSDHSDTGGIEEDESVCAICGGMPCEWEEFGPELVRRQSLLATKQRNEEGEEQLIATSGRSISDNKMRIFKF